MRPGARLDQVRKANQKYLGLKREGLGAEQLFLRKLQTAFWRARMLDEAVQEVAAGAVHDMGALVAELCELGVYLKREHRALLTKTIEDQDLLAQLMAQQGARVPGRTAYYAAAGPGIDRNIPVNRDSAWPFSRWKNDARFTEYEFRGESVWYRGLRLLPGDVILANANLDGNGVYTALWDPKSYCSHAAVFTVLQDADRRFPAVIETYEKGVRAVPLNIFMGPRYVAYAEIYRHSQAGTPHFKSFGQAALTAIDRAKGYSFYPEDEDRSYVSCTTIGRFLHVDAGLGRIRPMSSLADEGIRENLARLGYTQFSPFLAPVDYMLNEDFHRVGWIDNNQLDKLVARELVEGRFRKLLSSRQLNTRRLPLIYRFNLWGIGQMRRRSAFGALISAVAGFDHASLPKGPDQIIALVKPLEAQLGKAIAKVLPFVRNYLANLEQFDYQAMSGDRRVEALLDRHVRFPWL